MAGLVIEMHHRRRMRESRSTSGRRKDRPHRLNLKFLRRTIGLSKPYWFSDDKRRAWLLLGLLMLLLVGYTEFAVLFNHQSGEFTSALAERNGPRFWHSIRIFFLLLVVGVPIDAYYYYVRDRLALNWRRWLTDRYLDRYFAGRRFYHLVSNPEVDNPDQRIADDIYSFTRQSLTFVLIFANGLFQLLAFSSVLWHISRSLVLFLFLYAAIITGATFGIFGEKMVTLNFFQRRREADFRFGLVRIRENAEAIALYQGERLEKQQLRAAFGRLFQNAAQIIRWSLGLNFFYYSNSFLAMVLPTLIIAPRVLSGELEVGRIVQATGAFAAILAALSLLVDNLEDMSRFAASVGRLETLAQALGPERVAGHARNVVSLGGNGQGRKEAGKIHAQEGDELEFDKVTLRPPGSDRTLIRELTASVPLGEGLMIVGPSGLGKSSLLRAVAGLWNSGDGTIVRPKFQEMLFLPQHAYMAIGNLRFQLSYPNVTRQLSDDQLREVLELVNLPDLVERCGGFDADFDFEKVLSVGERQRLAFARIFLNEPRYVLLDEATSALDRDNEAALYERLAESGITVVSVSHHPPLVRYHANVLELKGDGEWKLHSAGKFRFTENLV